MAFEFSCSAIFYYPVRGKCMPIENSRSIFPDLALLWCSNV